MRRAVVALLLVTASTAHAEKHKKTAQALSGIGAGVSSAAILTAFIVSDGTSYEGNWTPGHINHPLLYAGLGASLVTPSLGEYYVGQYLTYGEAVRATAGILAGIAVEKGTKKGRCDNIDDPTVTCDVATRTSVVLLSIAAIMYVGGVAYDVLDAGDAVDRYNASHGGVIIVPTVGSGAAGLAIAGRF